MKRLRLAVTGLKQAGKTVFLTSLINHLLEGSEDTLSVFAEEGVSVCGKLELLKPGTARFPYELNMEALRQEEPQWPARTEGVSEIHVRLTFRGTRSRDLLMELVDYPGERLLDLPLLTQDYEVWSEEVVRAAQLEPYKGFSTPWLDACKAIPSGAEAESPELASAIESYRGFVCECASRGLHFHQPSAFVMRNADPALAHVRFCPLPRETLEAAPDTRNVLGHRYRTYVRDYVKPFFRMIAGCSRQVVLVDVLRILRRGMDCYNDTRRCVQTVLDAFGYARQRAWFSPLCLVDRLVPKIERVAFVATMADQCASPHRANLKALLAELVRPKKRELPADRVKLMFCASNRATEDARKMLDGRPVSCLSGRLRDGDGTQEGVYNPGEVPFEWPINEWDAPGEGFNFPNFLPKRLPKRDGVTVPHIDLDKVLLWTVEDLIR